MGDDPGRPHDGRPQDSDLAAERLRLRTSMDTAEIVGITLDALVPAFADAAAVYAAEDILHGRGSGRIRPVRPDASGRVTVRRAGTRFIDDRQGYAAFPAGSTVAFAADSPCARCVLDGKTVAFTSPGNWMLNRTGRGGRAVLSRLSSYLAVPLTADGATVGLIALAQGPGRPPFADTGTDAIARLASYAGTGLASVMAAERHQAITLALQKGLLAAEPPQPSNLNVSGTCCPVDGHLVGGDWYDIVTLPHGRTGIVVGDVMGHGAEAAAVMAQLRAAARVLAQAGMEPAEVLTRLNLLVETLPGLPMATCLYAVIDPDGQTCTLAAAGHLPPVLALPDGASRVLDLPNGLSLGVGVSDFGQARIKLRPGATIAFYTDGLVETRHRSFDQGTSVLRAELNSAGDTPLNITRDKLIRALAAGPEDDATLILARIPE